MVALPLRQQHWRRQLAAVEVSGVLFSLLKNIERDTDKANDRIIHAHLMGGCYGVKLGARCARYYFMENPESRDGKRNNNEGPFVCYLKLPLIAHQYRD